MGKYFDDIHESWSSQLENTPCRTEDTETIKVLREGDVSCDNLVALGDALTKQLRYREAAEVYTTALREHPDNLHVLRLRAGRYLSTLQCSNAQEDLIRCRELGGDASDILYRLGLCSYFLGQYSKAAELWEECFPLCDEEMGIAVIYWHTIASYCLRKEPVLLKNFHTKMEVGHHTAYYAAVRVFAQTAGINEIAAQLEEEQEDLEYVIVLYGLCCYWRHKGDLEKFDEQIEKLIARDGFWPCYAYLAAVNEKWALCS